MSILSCLHSDQDVTEVLWSLQGLGSFFFDCIYISDGKVGVLKKQDGIVDESKYIKNSLNLYTH